MTVPTFEPVRLLPGLAANDAAVCSADACTMADDGKAFATLQARAALAGWSLLAQPAGCGMPFVLSRWGRAHELSDLAAVAAFLRRVGVPE